MDRRSFIRATAGLAASAVAASTAVAAEQKMYQGGKSPWPLCLNASTIRPTPVGEKVRVAAEAGYDALELWMQDLEQWVADGKKLEDLRKEIEDRGMFVINVIGLWDCMPQDAEEYKKALEVTKQRMAMCAAVGSRHVAVLPLPDRFPFDLHYAAAKYREMLELGLNEFGINPAMEFVSVFKGIRRMGEAVQIAMDADHPKAMIIPDTFHLYNGGSGFEGVRHIQGKLIASFHWNDVPAELPAGALKDAERIYPGEGQLPLVETLKVLKEIGYFGPLSLELFRKEHWESDPLVVAKNGIEAMRRNVAAAVGSA